MSQYITIDGHSYYNPCADCKENSCYSCLFSKYKEDLRTEHDKRTRAEWLVDQELEPRIKAEKASYDRWISTDTGEREYESFLSLVCKLIDFVEDPGNQNYMEWEDPYGNLEEMILFLIKHKDDARHYHVTSNW